MNFKIKELFSNISKKTALQIYFVLFILLNVFDFFNFLSGDIDFFKKLLSWFLIGMIFYKASFSKMFVGVCDRFYDWMFLLGFSLMGIVKSLFHYIKISDLNDFIIFGWFLRLFPQSSEPFLTNSFLLGAFVVILSSVFLIRKHNPKEDSLIGSFNFSEYFKFIGAQYFTLSIISLFFGLVVFNYVMEWFALAVDAIILVLGLIFYLFLYLHRHTDMETDLLSKISNTGNDFYQNMINQFSNKKTFMIGVSFILTLHLLVDIGVYLIPFSTGLTNSLYGSFVVDEPIFNFFDFKESLFFMDMATSGFEPISIISLFLINVFSIIFFVLIMFLPFYYFYKNVSFEKFQMNKWMESLFLIGLFVQLIVFLIPKLTNPILVDWTFQSQIIGVDLNSSAILSSAVPVSLILALIMILFLAIESRYLLKSSINDFVKKKIISGVVLIFFFGYILVFGVSTVSNEFETTILKDRINSDKDEYFAIIESYNLAVEDRFNSRVFSPQKTISTNYFDMQITPYSTFDYENPNNEKIDFLIVKLSNIDTSNDYEILNHKKAVVFDGEFQTVSKYFQDEEFTFVYKLGNNGFDIETMESGFRITKLNFDITSLIDLSDKSKLTNFVEMIRLLILTVFYFGGLIVFSIHFYRSNIKRNINYQ